MGIHNKLQKLLSSTIFLETIMDQVQFTLYGKTLVFLSFLLYIEGYLFTNLLPVFVGTFIMIFLVYTKMSFKPKLNELVVQRKLMEKLFFANHPINVRTTITNDGGVIKLNVIDELPRNTQLLKGENSIERLVNTGEEITLDYQVVFTSRGHHQFDGVKFILSDRWNLHTCTMNDPYQTVVLVHSDPEEIKKAKRVSTREHIELGVPSVVGAETLYEIEGIRRYEPGDRLKDIEWKATSRLQKLMTKVYEKKEMVATFILLDCSRSMRRTTGDKSKLDHATNLAIHLTKILQSLRHPVGIIAYDEFKTLITVEPTSYHTKIFEILTSLPDQIQTKGFSPKMPVETDEITSENPQENQRFLATVFPFLAKGKRVLRHPSQASGIYEALRPLFMDATSKHLIVITDLETNRDALYTSLSLAHSKKYIIWLLTSFSPSYHFDKKQLTTKHLEDMYTLHVAREKIFLKLKKMNIEIVELTPSMEGGRIIEKIRRKQP